MRCANANGNDEHLVFAGVVITPQNVVYEEEEDEEGKDDTCLDTLLSVSGYHIHSVRETFRWYQATPGDVTRFSV